tara:strand:- start:192 stop:431 length:240 start_codon:yes stop_codon:yes gene_type:complete
MKINDIDEEINMESTHENDKTFENETSAPSPMVQISLKEYDKLKEKQHFITDKDLIACIDKIEELVRAIRKHIVRSDIE